MIWFNMAQARVSYSTKEWGKGVARLAQQSPSSLIHINSQIHDRRRRKDDES